MNRGETIRTIRVLAKWANAARFAGQAVKDTGTAGVAWGQHVAYRTAAKLVARHLREQKEKL